MITQERAVELFVKIAGATGKGITIPAGQDDCGAIEIGGGRSLILTTDFTNFRPHLDVFSSSSLEAKGRLLVLHNVSDLLASGTNPLGFVAACGLPPGFTEKDVRFLAKGLKIGASEANVAIIGGDTKESPILSLCGTAFGVCRTTRIWRRRNGSPGDDLFLSGAIGGVTAAVYVLTNKERRGSISIVDARRQLASPTLPMPLFSRLRKHGFRIAAIDVSDGFGWDVVSLAQASGVGVTVYADRLPISDFATRVARRFNVSSTEFAFGLGGDLQFVFAANARHRRKIEACGGIRVGQLTDSREATVHVGRKLVRLPAFGHHDFTAVSSRDEITKIIGTRF